jgi:hypothetical protein
LSAGYSYGSVDTQGYGTQRDAQGWSGSLTANLKKWAGVEAEVSSRFQTFNFNFQGNPLAVDSRYYTFLVGPRFAHRKGKVTPFVHGLFGLDRSLAYDNTVYDPASGSSVTPYVNGIAAAAGGGFDYAISRRLAFRSQADYFFTRQPASFSPTPNNFRVMAAIVFTFGQTESAYARRKSEVPVVAESSAPVQAAPTERPVAASFTSQNSEIALDKAPIPELAESVPAAPVAPQMPIAIASARSNELIANVQPVTRKATNAFVPQPVAPVQVHTAAVSAVNSSPNSPIVAQAPRQLPQTLNSEESLGDIARRYREQKRRNAQAQGSPGS